MPSHVGLSLFFTALLFGGVLSQNYSDCENACYTRLSVTGTSTRKVLPDTATIALGVITQAPKASDAVQQNANIVSATVNSIRQLEPNTTKVSISTSGLSITAMTPPCLSWPCKVDLNNITGYEVRHSIRVVSHDLSIVGKLIDGSVGAGANTLDGLSFSLADQNRVQRQALQDAILDALGKANLYARTLGGTVVGIATVSESSSYGPLFNSFGMDRVAAAAPEAVPTNVQVGDIDVTATVSLDVRISIDPQRIPQGRQ